VDRTDGSVREILAVLPDGSPIVGNSTSPFPVIYTKDGAYPTEPTWPKLVPPVVVSDAVAFAMRDHLSCHAFVSVSHKRIKAALAAALAVYEAERNR
jgi:hypothetical protein